MNTKKSFILLLIGAVLGALGFGFIHHRYGHSESGFETKTDTVIVVRIDTIKVDKPILTEKTITRTELLKVTDTIRVKDTVFMQIPIETKVYSDSLYKAQISGYMANLDWLEVYPRYITVTTTERTYIKPTKINLGVYAGYGLTYSNGIKAGPQVGVGVTYNFFGRGNHAK